MACFSLAKATVKRLNALCNGPRYPLYDSIPHTRSALRSFCLGFPDWISFGRRGRQRFRWLMCGLVASYTSTGERYARDKAFELARSRSGSIDSCPPLKDDGRGGEALRQVETLGNSSSLSRLFRSHATAQEETWISLEQLLSLDCVFISWTSLTWFYYLTKKSTRVQKCWLND